MRYTDKSDEKVYDEIKSWVQNQFPQEGIWYVEYHNLPLGSDELFCENFPYHATDIEWIKRYIIHNYKIAYNYTMLKQMAMEKFLESDDFLLMVQEYQDKIIDWQINWNRKHNEEGELFYLLPNVEDKINKLYDEVYNTLTSVLNMDEEIVKRGIHLRKEDMINRHNQTVAILKNMPLFSINEELIEN